jgi:glucokinase
MFLGIEIGGTKLQLGLGEGDGSLRGLWRGPVEVAAGAEGIRKQIVHAVPELLANSRVDKASIRGIGIGFGGPVDDATHTVIKSHQIAGWDNFPLADWLSNLFGWPAVLGNDADVAGLAEALFGAGKGLSPIFYITIGSGIGGGLIINGEIYRGCGRGAAEIGHVRVPIAASPPNRFAILEELASGWAIERQGRERGESGGAGSQALLQRIGGKWQDLKAHHLADAARKQDPFAWEILNSAWDSLAEGICHVITLLCPGRIVIGGGVALMGEDLLFGPLRQKVAERVFKPFAECYDIVPAALGEDVVVHGAMALARKRLAG